MVAKSYFEVIPDDSPRRDRVVAWWTILGVIICGATKKFEEK